MNGVDVVDVGLRELTDAEFDAVAGGQNGQAAGAAQAGLANANVQTQVQDVLSHNNTAVNAAVPITVAV